MLAENEFKRTSVLHKLQESLNQSGIGSRIIEKGEEGSPAQVLVCTFERPSGESITGQYYFPEADCAENVCYFSALMSIRDTIPEKEEEGLRKLVDETNDALMCGMFSLLPELGLIYRLTVPVSEYLSENDLFDTIDIASAHALAFSSEFLSHLEGETFTD